MQHLLIDADAQMFVLSINPLRPTAEVTERVEYLNCPTCGNLMNRMKYARGSTVLTHACTGHGIWLTLAALQEIILFICSGGLERAQQKDKEEKDRKREMEYLTNFLNVGGSGHYGPII